MAENKTTANDSSVEEYLAAIEDDSRRADCQVLARIMAKATNQKPRMWGDAIVGFGTLRYKYESGREGEICLVGFSSRKKEISIYGIANGPAQLELLARLGKHKMGKGCLYVGKLKDIDVDVLETLIRSSALAKGG